MAQSGKVVEGGWGKLRIAKGNSLLVHPLAAVEGHDGDRDESQKDGAEQDRETHEMAPFDFGRLDGGRDLAGFDREGHEAIFEGDGGQPSQPGTEDLMIEIALTRAIGRENTNESVGDGFAGNFDALHDEDDLSAGEFGFYNFSQQAVHYAGFEQTGGEIVPDAVPEPASIIIWTIIGAVFGCVAWRRRRK